MNCERASARESWLWSAFHSRPFHYEQGTAVETEIQTGDLDANRWYVKNIEIMSSGVDGKKRWRFIVRYKLGLEKRRSAGPTR